MASQPSGTLTSFKDIKCCPDLDTSPTCDIIDLRRRLVFPTTVRGPNEQPVRVEVIIHTRFERCSGPLALGDLAYTTTLLPGETVRLTTTDRRSRFSFDSESNLSYRSEQMSEEQYRMTALRTFMSDQNVVDRGEDRASSQGSWDFHGDASGGLGFFSVSADTNARGSHNESSARDYLREHKAHAESSDHQSVEATRKAHSVSIGEVSSRVHSEGQSEDQFEASSRAFSNTNKCHAVTYLFYRINKTETIKFTLESIARRVIDPVAPLPIPANPLRDNGKLSAIHQEVPASAKTRIEIETRGFQSEALQRQGAAGANRLRAATFAGASFGGAAADLGFQQPLTEAAREAALKEVDDRLAKIGLIERESGAPTKETKIEIEFTRKTSLPTAGIIVKGCLDPCNTCEPGAQRRELLEIERLDLQNQLLKKQIELLQPASPGTPAGDDATPAPVPGPAPRREPVPA